MVSFEKFVKSMPPSLSELKVLPSFCFAFKIPDNVTASKLYLYLNRTTSDYIFRYQDILTEGFGDFCSIFPSATSFD